MELFKNKHVKKYIARIGVFFALSFTVLLTTGCEFSLYEEKDADEPKLIRYKKKDLEDNKYYVREGTSFYEPYKATQTFTSSYTVPDDKRVIWMSESEEVLIPTLYKGEELVYATSATIPETISLERFKDCGYTFGIMGFEPKESGQIIQYTTAMEHTLAGTDAYNKFSTVDASTVTVAEINGVAIAEEDFTYGGVLIGTEKGKTSLVGLYVGSYYNELKLKADTRVFSSDSLITLENISLTKNGYYAIQVNEDMESGYYYLQDYGIFRYIDVEKKDIKENPDISYNRNLVTTGCKTGRTQTDLKVYSYELKETNEKVDFAFSVPEGSLINSITGYMPDGTTFEAGATYTIENAKQGTYSFKINTTLLEGDVQMDITLKEIPAKEPEEPKEEAPANTEPKEEEKESEQTSSQSTEQKQQTSSKKNNTSKQEYEWVAVMPEPLEKTEISETKKGN